MTKPWKPISKKLLLEHPRLLVEEERLVLPSGQEIDYLLVDTKNDYVTVIAENSDGEVLIINEYSYPVSEVLTQFPEGVCDKNEKPEETALRELREETGFLATKLTVLGSNLHLHRRNTRRNFVVLAQDLQVSESGGGEPEESDITLQWLTQNDVWQLIKSGKIIQKNTLSAWSIYQASKK